VKVEVPELQAIADRIVAQAKPGEQIEAYVGRGGETSVRVYEGELEHFVSAQSDGVGIRVIKDGRTGTAYAGTLDEGAIAEVLAEARDNVQFGTHDEFAGLALPDGVEPVPQKFWDDELANYPTESKVDLTKDLERRALAADSRVRTESANYDDGWGETAFATTTGIRTSGRANSCYVSVVTLADDGDETQTGFGFSVGDSPKDFDLDKAAREAADRATRLLGATKPATKRTTIVLDPYVTSQFVSLVTEMLSGESVSRGRSPFADRVGEVVAAPGFTLLDDAVDPLAPTASDLDGEGLACRPVPLVADGVLQGFLHNAYTARSMGTTSTGSAQRGSHRSVPGVGPRVAKVLPGALSPEQVLAQVGDGLLVHEVSGLHSGVNPVSGDLSVGVEGVMVAGGEQAGAVREATINSTLQRMLTDVVAIGADLTYFPWEACGVTLAVADVTLSGS